MFYVSTCQPCLGWENIHAGLYHGASSCTTAATKIIPGYLIDYLKKKNLSPNQCNSGISVYKGTPGAIII